MSIGKRLAEWRKREGVTLETLAHRLRVSVATVHRWESEKVKPQGLYREKLERFLTARDA